MSVERACTLPSALLSSVTHSLHLKSPLKICWSVCWFRNSPHFMLSKRWRSSNCLDLWSGDAAANLGRIIVYHELCFTWFSEVFPRKFMVYLLTAIGLSPGGSSTVHIYTQTIHRTTQITINLEECGPCPVFASFTLAFALQLRKKHRKTSVRVRKTPVRV
jgi:hypothetical protein